MIGQDRNDLSREERQIRSAASDDDIRAARQSLDDALAAEIGMGAQKPAGDRRLPIDAIFEGEHVVADEPGYLEAAATDLLRKRRDLPRRGDGVGGAEVGDDVAIVGSRRWQQRLQPSPQAGVGARGRIGGARPQARHERSLREAFEHHGVGAARGGERDRRIDPVPGEAGPAADRASPGRALRHHSPM